MAILTSTGPTILSIGPKPILKPGEEDKTLAEHLPIDKFLSPPWNLPEHHFKDIYTVEKIETKHGWTNIPPDEDWFTGYLQAIQALHRTDAYGYPIQSARLCVAKTTRTNCSREPVAHAPGLGPEEVAGGSHATDRRADGEWLAVVG